QAMGLRRRRRKLVALAQRRFRRDVARARAADSVLPKRRMAAPRLLDHIPGERVRVVWAQKAPGRAAVEGEVEERLVVLALHQLVRGAAGPDRLADAAEGPAGRALLV